MHAYLHFPFCTGRCNYCAFLSGPPPHDPTTYIDELLREVEIRSLILEPFETLYCGGGTPGLLGIEGFRRLHREGFCRLVPGGEWTVELHPTTVTPALMETLAELGVTRISIGVQSFDDATLQRCHRRHTAREALDAIDIARHWIPDTGIDLIAGLPGVSPQQWNATLNIALGLALPHLSVYALSIDEGSVWSRMQLSPPDDDTVCDTIAIAARRLEAEGLLRYETSNYARTGYACRHNLNTWQGGDYLGLGRGAVSRLGFLRRYGDGTEEVVTPLDDTLERALTHLRLRSGFNPEVLFTQFPLLQPYQETWRQILTSAVEQGLLTPMYAPTLRGYEVLDALERTFLETLPCK